MKTTEIATFAKSLLPNLPGFAAKRQMLLMRPVGHTLRAIFFDRSVSPRGFYVQVSFNPYSFRRDTLPSMWVGDSVAEATFGMLNPLG